MAASLLKPSSWVLPLSGDLVLVCHCDYFITKVTSQKLCQLEETNLVFVREYWRILQCTIQSQCQCSAQVQQAVIPLFSEANGKGVEVVVPY